MLPKAIRNDNMVEALIAVVLWCDPDLFQSNAKVMECRKAAIVCTLDKKMKSHTDWINCLLEIKIPE